MEEIPASPPCSLSRWLPMSDLRHPAPVIGRVTRCPARRPSKAPALGCRDQKPTSANVTHHQLIGVLKAWEPVHPRWQTRAPRLLILAQKIQRGHGQQNPSAVFPGMTALVCPLLGKTTGTCLGHSRPLPIITQTRRGLRVWPSSAQNVPDPLQGRGVVEGAKLSASLGTFLSESGHGPGSRLLRVEPHILGAPRNL